MRLWRLFYNNLIGSLYKHLEICLLNNLLYRITSLERWDTWTLAVNNTSALYHSPNSVQIQNHSVRFTGNPSTIETAGFTIVKQIRPSAYMFLVIIGKFICKGCNKDFLDVGEIPERGGWCHSRRTTEKKILVTLKMKLELTHWAEQTFISSELESLSRLCST